jgi:hypothetical protein
MSAKVSGVTNWVAPAVITTCTERSCFVNLLAISAALYAAIEAVTPRMMFMRAVFIPHSGSRIFFQLGFALDDNLGDLGVVCFSAERIQLAAEFLADELKRLMASCLFVVSRN